jgi:hypothetical protein
MFGGESFLSKRMRSDRPAMEPKMTPDGKFVCEADNRTFNSREDFDRHCSQAHMSSKSW